MASRAEEINKVLGNVTNAYKNTAQATNNNQTNIKPTTTPAAATTTPTNTKKVSIDDFNTTFNNMNSAFNNQAIIKENGGYKPTTYTNANGDKLQGYIINGVTYQDPTGKTPVEYGSIVTAGDNKQYIKTAQGGVLLDNYKKQNWVDKDGVTHEGYTDGKNVYTDANLSDPITNYPGATTVTDQKYFVDAFGQGQTYTLEDYIANLALNKLIHNDNKSYYEKAEEALSNRAETSKNILEQSKDTTNDDYDKLARQLYTNYVLGNSDTLSLLQSLGLGTTGLTESTLNQNANQYQANLNQNELERQAVIRDITNQIAKLEADTGVDIAELWTNYANNDNALSIAEMLLNYSGNLINRNDTKAEQEQQKDDTNWELWINYASQSGNDALLKKLLTARVNGVELTDVISDTSLLSNKSTSSSSSSGSSSSSKKTSSSKGKVPEEEEGPSDETVVNMVYKEIYSNTSMIKDKDKRDDLRRQLLDKYHERNEITDSQLRQLYRKFGLGVA